ncbi:MAG: FtsW/RodA/SpoVE family cell cycle protein [Firmicutes bacterium]|nr:FtsW/RodA/SpoVE family cell cycle protein [Bacillota bacterium]
MKGIIRTIRKTYRDMDKTLFWSTIAMFVFGLLSIVSASSREAVVRYGSTLYHYFFRQLIMMSAGFVLSFFIINVNSKKYKSYALIGFIGVNLLLIYLWLYGTAHKGAQNWLYIPFLGSFQPSEFAKPVIIVCLSLLFDQFYKNLRNPKIKHWDMIGTILVVGLFSAVIVFLQKDLGTMMIIVAIFGVMFMASPILRSEKIKTIGLLLIVGTIGALGMYAIKGYILTDAQLSRFNFFNPCTRYETGGYQVCNGFIALNDGGLFGLGIGKSKQKYSYISEPHTDSIFAIIGEELGFFRSSLVFGIYILILYRILKLSSNANTIRGKYICLGVAVYLFMHIFLNLGGILGIIPLTGVPLPFLSYGGSFTISFIISLTLVQRVAIETNRQKITV